MSAFQAKYLPLSKAKNEIGPPLRCLSERPPQLPIADGYHSLDMFPEEALLDFSGTDVSTQDCPSIIGPCKRAKPAAITSSPDSSYSSNRLNSTNLLDTLCLGWSIELGLEDLMRFRSVGVLYIATNGLSLLQSSVPTLLEMEVP